MANEFTAHIAGVGPVTFPTDIAPAELHRSLVEYVQPPDLPAYMPQPDSLPVQQPQPTSAGAIENSVPFRMMAQQAWDKTGRGLQKSEAGFPIMANGYAGDIQKAFNANGGGEIPMNVTPDTIAVVHTHPNMIQDQPSPGDIASAKKFGHPIYVVSRSGLWEADQNGNLTHVYSDPNWMNQPIPQ